VISVEEIESYSKDEVFRCYEHSVYAVNLSWKVQFATAYYHFRCFCVQLVEGGHRAIIFSRIGGVQPDIYREGLHFRYAFFRISAVFVM